MAINLTVPPFGESVTEAVIARWYVREGDIVAKDQPVCEIESDKVNQELPSPVTGRLVAILKQADEPVSVGEVIGQIEPVEAVETGTGGESSAEDADTPGHQAPPPPTGPAARRLLAEHGIEPTEVTATGPSGRLTKGDVLAHVAHEQAETAAVRTGGEEGATGSAVSPAASGTAAATGTPRTTPRALATGATRSGKPTPDPVTPVSEPAPPRGLTWTPAAPSSAGRRGAEGREEHVRMSPLRKKVAQRLVDVQRNAAILTTFNEVDMSAIMALRKRYQARFVEKYGIKLGFMSFFVKACIDALRAFPGVNAEIRDDEIVYKRYYDIGVAVGGGKGLVVPVVRDADRMGFAEVELAIAALAEKARNNKLSLEELSGGTFTISNGGIYGSLMSTPILNPPQSGILGMHKIEDRPVVVDGQIVVRPMMYLALSYDHRVIDGREAVSFLVRVKECIEGPERMLLEV